MSTALAAARAKTKGKRMLRDALEGYGEDAFTLSEWNAKKREAEAEGKWTWKQSVASTNAAVKARVERDGSTQDALKARFVDVQTAMEQEMGGMLRGREVGSSLPEDESSSQCCWRDRIGGKMYHCVNDPPVAKKLAKPSEDASSQQAQQSAKSKQYCRWHARECTHSGHPMERSRVIEVANEFGLCLTCYEATATTQRGTLQKTPPRVMVAKIPGVRVTDLRRDVQRGVLLTSKKLGNQQDEATKFTAKSVCTWQKEHSEKAYVWRCSNRVLMHPTLSGSYLSFCGFHAPRCVKEYGRKSKKDQLCPPLDRLNAFGMCRNHLEAHLSTLSYEARGSCVLVDSEFDVPGIKECKRDPSVSVILRHPLAPERLPPPRHAEAADGIAQHDLLEAQVENQDGLVKQTITFIGSLLKNRVEFVVSSILDSPHPVSMALRELIWRFQFTRRASVVAIRIQRIFRGNRARRRVRALRYEHAAFRRIRASQVLQKYVRGYLGRQKFRHELEDVQRAVPTMQRVVRGGLARKRCRELRASIRIQCNYRCYRQRVLAWAFREEMEYMKGLQREADENLREMEEKLETFRRLRARRLLRAQMLRWKKQKEVKALEFALRLQSFWGAVKIQRQWRRHRYYETVKKRYHSALCIQKRVRGWLTRHMWKEDPGILRVTSFVNTKSAFEYGKVVVLAQPSRSYAYPSRRIRMLYGAMTIQRLFRGYLGRLRANEQWLNMVRRWEWIGIGSTDSTGQSSDSMTVGKERYGYILPSCNYHEDRRLHMKPVVHDIKAVRGFAYEYQYILDLIKDRDGLRAWSLTHERREQYKRHQEQIEKASSSSATTVKDPSTTKRNSPKRESISVVKAVFPVGSIVQVAVFNASKNGNAYHQAKIVRINDHVDGQECGTTFDVEYVPAFVKVHGVRIYNEQRVRASRLKAIAHADRMEPPPEQRKSVGRHIQIAINRLKKEIRAAKLAGNHDSPVASNGVDQDKAAKTVGELVERLRDDRKGFDLLADDSAFVNFVFRNSTLLTTTWLQVVDDIKYGTHSSATYKGGNNAQTTGACSSYVHEIGFIQQERVNVDMPKPMPQRAAIIEKRMTELGFQHSPGARARQELPDVISEQNDIQQRPETTNEGILTPSRNERYSRDDLALKEVEHRVQSSQDLHRLIYELKTLPKEHRREDIIEITTRIARAFVCGHPACGQCFSSMDAARLHQKTSHEHKERLALKTPLTDQYMHAYWPPQSPWSHEANAQFQRMVGYFRCSRPGCEQVEFRTRRELNNHMVQDHHARATATAPSLQEDADLIARPSVNLPPTTVPVQVIWLGSYSISRNLNDRLGVSKSSFELVICPLHPRVFEADCNVCIRQQSIPSLPCKVYSSVALRLGAASSSGQVQGVDIASDNGYTIFGAQDPEFCPIVLEHSLAYAKERVERPRKIKGQANTRLMAGGSHLQEPEKVAYVQVTLLCRDSKNEGWILGRAFRRSAAGSATPVVDGSANYKQSSVGIYGVDVDERFVCAKLSQVVGAGRLRGGSKSVLHESESNHGETRSAVENDESRGADASGYVIEELFCCR